jgi:hypothetical protein
VATLIKVLSPKVREFISRHGEVNQILVDVFMDQPPPNHDMRLYYFYTEDVAAAPAYYYWMGSNHVVIAVSESQKPVDEFIEIIFEMINSERDQKWQQLSQEAAHGRIGRQILRGS